MAEEKKSGRTYHVLKQAAEEGEWSEVAEIEASSPSQAIRLVVVDFDGGTYAAIPDGNWTVESYKVEPQPPKITKVESGWKWDDAPPPASASPARSVDDYNEDLAADVHSVAVGEQETIDDERPVPPHLEADDDHGPSEATRAELRRQAAEREAQQA